MNRGSPLAALAPAVAISSGCALGQVPLEASPADASEADARNAIHIVMEGVGSENGDRVARMPGFAAQFTDRQVAALVDYLRARFTGRAARANVAQQVATVRQSLEEEP